MSTAVSTKPTVQVAAEPECCTYLSPFQPELIDKDDAVTLRNGEPGAVGAEAQVSDDVVLGALFRGFGGESVSFFSIFVVQSHHSVRLLGGRGRERGRRVERAGFPRRCLPHGVSPLNHTYLRNV